MVAEEERVAQDALGGEGKITHPAVPPDTQVVLCHLTEVQGEGVAHKGPFPEGHSEYIDYPLALFLLALIVVVVGLRTGYEGVDSEDDVASYASDEAGKRGDAEQPAEAVVQTRRRVMQ